MIKSYAKINLSLSVIKKLRLNLHNIESLITFIDLYDKIYIKEIFGKNHKIKFYGKFAKKIPRENTIFNLLKELDKKKLLNKKYQINIHKKIPLESGMGGGSMNAASILKYLVDKKKININSKNLKSLTKKIGSDVIVGMYNKPIIFSKDEVIRLKKKINLYLVILKPNFGCSTKKIYSKVKKYSKSNLNRLKKKYRNLKYLKNLNNDLEKVAINLYPKLYIYKEYMLKLPMVSFVRMTGSGSSIIGYFTSKKASINASKILKKKFKNYLCISSKTI
tara:strand:- start:336 stop:1166 length:831 start_codon:yes stop_codon:yes gene_type:complete